MGPAVSWSPRGRRIRELEAELENGHKAAALFEEGCASKDKYQVIAELAGLLDQAVSPATPGLPDLSEVRDPQWG